MDAILSNVPVYAFVALGSLGVALLGYGFSAALTAGADEYSRRFTAQSQATLEEMLVFMPSTWLMTIKLSCMCFAAFLAWVLTLLLNNFYQTIGLMVILAVPAFFIPDIMIKRAYQTRLKKFHTQMIDGLRILANCLKADISMEESFRIVSNEMPAPLGDEFRLVTQEITLGLSMERALENLTRRMPIKDLQLFVASVSAVARKGRGLTEICEKSTEMIAERFRIERRIDTLTAEGRMQSYVLTLAPFFLMLVLFFIDPSLVMLLFNTFTGMLVLLAALILDGIGFLIIRRITNIEV